MGQFLIALIGIVLVAAVMADQAAWNSFKIRHGKNYKNVAEERTRMKNFMDNLKAIAEHNELFKNGVVSYEKGLNEYSDMSDDEFHSAMNGYGSNNDVDDDNDDDRQTHEISDDDEIPGSIDWRTKGAVTAVKNQRHCNSCWTFGSLGALEGAYFIKTGDLTPLSEQNLIDCIDEDEKQCYSGTFRDTYDYIMINGGIDTNKSYPYRAEKDKCKYNPDNSGANVTGYVRIPRGNERALTHAIATVGPVTLAINAHLIQHYKGGVFHNPKCSQRMNHEVLAVGYGTDKKDGDYYIIKNSYGTSWGEDGYMRLARNRGNLCGVANDAAYPIV